MTEPYYKTHEPPHCPTCDCGMKRDEMRDRLEALELDARRYRRLRNAGLPLCFEGIEYRKAADFDAAIDAEMGE